MEELFRKYLDNQCSPSEVRKLMDHFSAEENEQILRGLISETLQNIHIDSNETNIQSLADDTFSLISAQIKAEEVKVVPLFRKDWFRIVAAATLLLGIFGIYTMRDKSTQPESEVVKTNVNPEEINPGSNKALLTLADGSIITLEHAGKGELTQQGGTKILKPQNGQLIYNSSNDKPTQVLFNSLTTPRGGQYQLTLSDGSRAWLNAASTLRFPVAFSGRERRVEISGEVYFEVTRHSSMPFIVTAAGKTEVEVLGTKFNINSYNDEKTINATLLEGSIKVSGLAAGNSRIISPGEQAQLNAVGQIRLIKNADTEQAIAWKKGMFNFTGASLESVLRQISRWYDVEVFYEGPIPQMQFGGEIQRDLNLTQVLRILEKNNVHFRTEGKKIIVLK